MFGLCVELLDVALHTSLILHLVPEFSRSWTFNEQILVVKVL